MFVYWMLFLVPALASLSPARLDRRSQVIMLTLAGIALAILIGLRDEVGRDWNNYVRVANRVIYERLQDALFQVEPAYGVVAWFSERLGMGIYGANLVCGSILVLGLLAFCRAQPSPWLTLTLAIPVLVIGIGMSGIRQATAIGLLMLAMNAFVENKLRSYILWVLLAVPFHQTAAAFLPLAWFMRGRIGVLPVVVAGGLFGLLSVFVLRDSVTYYTESYLLESPEANGALPRVALNVAAALIFYYFRKEWAVRYRDGTLYSVLALTAIPMAAAVFAAPVASDRMSMYLIPLQIGVFARLPELLRSQGNRQAATAAVLILYALTLGIWLNFSPAAQSNWIPYQNLLWQ
jgi:hypothetical protein